MADKKRNPILDLGEISEKIERMVVKLPDGNKYEMRGFSEFSLKDRHRIGRSGKVIQEYFESDATEAEDERAAAKLREAVDNLIIDCPADTINSLTDTQLLKILEAWQDFNGMNDNAERS